MIERTHIGIFGKRNAGKSSIINMLTNQEVSIVSPLPGTTTDPVTKPIEINGIGACVFIDTAGYDDAGEIGAMRVTKTKQVLQRCDISLFVIPTTIIDNKDELNKAAEWYKLISERTARTIVVINEFSENSDSEGGEKSGSGDCGEKNNEDCYKNNSGDCGEKKNCSDCGEKSGSDCEKSGSGDCGENSDSDCGGVKREFENGKSSKCDINIDIKTENYIKAVSETILKGTKAEIVIVNARKGEGKEELLRVLGHIKERTEEHKIVTHLVKPGDVVLLVMPQDIQAPAGRLILPQVQTIRELLDDKCIVVSCTTENFKRTLTALVTPPSLIVTDSQAFKEVYENKPTESRLTSFSVLFAQWKGDINTFIQGAQALSTLNDSSRILIAEACSHAPLAEDIGREKIPALIHKTISKNIKIEIVSGHDWPENLETYDLIIHCGACMLSRQQVINRIKEAEKINKKITNYGVCIAYLNNILDKIIW